MKTSNIAIALSLIGVPAHAEIFSMKCFPEAGVPYTVTYNSDARQASITGGKTGFVRMYHAFEVKDNPSNHILHVATKALGQTRIVYLAFDYSGINTDVSATRVKGVDGSDKSDKCESDNFRQAALPMHEERSVIVKQPPQIIIEQQAPQIIYKYCHNESTAITGPYTGRVVGYEDHQVCD
jgi:hypothetical protein